MHNSYITSSLQYFLLKQKQWYHQGVFPGEHIGAFQKWLAWSNMGAAQKLGPVPPKCRLNKINPVKARKLVAIVSKVS